MHDRIFQRVPKKAGSLQMGNRHFSVINKKGLAASCVFLLAVIVPFSFFLAQALGGGSRLWIIPGIIFACFFMLGIMILVSVLMAGIDIKEGGVVFSGTDVEKGKHRQFDVAELRDIELRNGEGKALDPAVDSLIGARVAFILKNGDVKIYYPVGITARQFKSIKSGIPH